MYNNVNQSLIKQQQENYIIFLDESCVLLVNLKLHSSVDFNVYGQVVSNCRCLIMPCEDKCLNLNTL